MKKITINHKWAKEAQVCAFWFGRPNLVLTVFLIKMWNFVQSLPIPGCFILSEELRKAASTTSTLAERSEITQEHSSLETTHNLYGFWKFAFPGTKYINIKSSFFAADMELTIELWKSASTLDIPRNTQLWIFVLGF